MSRLKSLATALARHPAAELVALYAVALLLVAIFHAVLDWLFNS